MFSLLSMRVSRLMINLFASRPGLYSFKVSKHQGDHFMSRNSGCESKHTGSVVDPVLSSVVKKQKSSQLTAPVSLFPAIKQRVSLKGFGESAPAVSSTLTVEQFRQHYYDKKGLVAFCRRKGIATQGLKEDLNQRIEHYLKTGTVIRKANAFKMTRLPDSQRGLLCRETRVRHYKSDPATRRFFQSQLGDFTGFSAYVQKWIKSRLANGDVFTYGDAIDEHIRYMSLKSKGRVLSVTHDSCQYNPFFMDASRAKIKTPHTTKQAWFLVRNSAGPKTFERYLQTINHIADEILSERMS